MARSDGIDECGARSFRWVEVPTSAENRKVGVLKCVPLSAFLRPGLTLNRAEGCTTMQPKLPHRGTG